MFWGWIGISMRRGSLATLCPIKPQKWSNSLSIFPCSSPLSQPWTSDGILRPEPNPSPRGSAADTTRTASRKWTPETPHEFRCGWPSREALRETQPMRGRVQLLSTQRRRWSTAESGSTLFWGPNSWSSSAQNCPSFRIRCNLRPRRRLLRQQRRGTRMQNQPQWLSEAFCINSFSVSSNNSYLNYLTIYYPLLICIYFCTPNLLTLHILYFWLQIFIL